MLKSLAILTIVLHTFASAALASSSSVPSFAATDSCTYWVGSIRIALQDGSQALYLDQGANNTVTGLVGYFNPTDRTHAGTFAITKCQSDKTIDLQCTSCKLTDGDGVATNYVGASTTAANGWASTLSIPAVSALKVAGPTHLKTISDPTGKNLYESAIWSFDDSTQELTAQWLQPDLTTVSPGICQYIQLKGIRYVNLINTSGYSNCKLILDAEQSQ